MPVTSLTLRTMEARRYQDPAPNQQVRVDHNSTLTVVAKEAADRMRVEFSYTTNYGPLGVVKLEGALLVQDPGAGAAADAWATSRNLPPDLAQQVHGAVMSSCIPEAVGMAKTLRLPPPIPLPQVQFQQQKPPAGKPGATPAYDGPETA